MENEVLISYAKGNGKCICSIFGFSVAVPPVMEMYLRAVM